MASNDWQGALGALLNSGSLPEGETPEPAAPAPTAKKPADRLTIAYERKGRGGKEVTIISGFTLPAPELEALASKIKSALGTGGSARGGEILVQGDRREKVRDFLRKQGYKI